MRKYKPTYQISALDIETWEWIINHYAATVDDICEVRDIARRTAYEHMAEWVNHGYFFRKHGFVIPRQTAYWQCDSRFRYHDFGLIFLTHCRDINKVEHWLRIREDMVVLSWTGERQLRKDQGLQDHYEHFDGKTHVPDAVAEILSKKTGVIANVAIEVERTYKGPDRTDKILRILASEYEHIMYFADKERVYRPIETCISRLFEEKRKRFSLWELDTITCDPKLPLQRTQV